MKERVKKPKGALLTKKQRRQMKKWLHQNATPSKVRSATDAKFPKFYCKVCKMKTWTFHEHNGSNSSTTVRHVVIPSDSTNNL